MRLFGSFPPWLLQPHRHSGTICSGPRWHRFTGSAEVAGQGHTLLLRACWAGDAAAAPASPAAVIEPIGAQHLSPAEKAAVTAAHGSQHLTPPASGFPTLHSHAEGFCRANGDETCAALLPRSLGDTVKGTLLAVRASSPPPASARNVCEEKHYPLCLESTFTLQFGTLFPSENFISPAVRGTPRKVTANTSNEA